MGLKGFCGGSGFKVQVRDPDPTPPPLPPSRQSLPGKAHADGLAKRLAKEVLNKQPNRVLALGFRGNYLFEKQLGHMQ